MKIDEGKLATASREHLLEVTVKLCQEIAQVRARAEKLERKKDAKLHSRQMPQTPHPWSHSVRRCSKLVLRQMLVLAPFDVAALSNSEQSCSLKNPLSAFQLPIINHFLLLQGITAIIRIFIITIFIITI